MSANNVSVAHQAFNNLLTTLTPAQIQQFVQQIQATNTGPIASNNAPPTAAISAGTTTTAMSNRISTPRGKRTGENTKLRPLNSFIAFRSFYSAIFPELTQKVKSGLLRFLWKSDPYKAKWAILAKAYSIIRDDNPGKGVTLESFLALNSQFIGIVAPSDYLNAMGLQLIVDGDGNYSLAGGNQAGGLTSTNTTTNHSVDDIVRRCYDTGYVTGAAPSNGTGHQGVFAAQPSIPVSANTNTSAAHGNLGANATHSSNNGVATNAITATGGNGNINGGNAAVTSAPTTTGSNNGNVGGANANLGGNVSASTNASNSGSFWSGPTPEQLRVMINQVTGEVMVPYYGLFLPDDPTPNRDDSDLIDYNDFVNM